MLGYRQYFCIQDTGSAIARCEPAMDQYAEVGINAGALHTFSSDPQSGLGEFTVLSLCCVQDLKW